MLTRTATSHAFIVRHVQLPPRCLGLLAALTLALAATAAEAVAFGTWKTDDSVCEFGDGGISLVQQRHFAKDGAPKENYDEVMTAWIRDNCKNGQVLTMGDNTASFDSSRSIFRNVAIEACRAADIQTVEFVGEAGRVTVRGNGVRCPITKMDELKRSGGGGDGKKP